MMRLKRLYLPIFLCILCARLGAQVPFTCEDQFFLTLSKNVPSLNEVIIDPQTKSTVFRTINGNIGVDINAIGFRVTDNYIYGINPNTGDLLRVDATGKVVILGKLPLDPNRAYFAGDVSPDGRYLVLLGNATLATGTSITTDVVKVDLTQPGYPMSSVTVNQASMIFDIAFHPVTGLLYGYDGAEQRLVTIDPDQGQISFSFPKTSAPFITGSLFFDAYTNLYAYGSNSFTSDQNSLYLINPNTGSSTLIATGAVADASDGCSCPYTIEFSKSVEPRRVLNCQEVEYTFKITNASARPHADIILDDELPPGFTFVSVIKNPVGGTLISQPGDNRFRLENIDLQEGTFDIVIRVSTGSAPPGIYKNQAVLSNIPVSLGSARRSDDISTIILDDSTALEVIGLPIDTLTQIRTLCAGEGPLTINAADFTSGLPAGATYRWETGEMTSTLVVDQPGTYRVTITAGCDTAVVTYPIGTSAITVDILTADNLKIGLGDVLNIESVVTNTASELFVNWTDPQPAGSLSCTQCLNPVARPFNDILYTIQAQNELGCIAKDSIRVRVDKKRDVYFPNVFAPRTRNTENGYFYASGDVFTKLRVFEVYSRWGEKVYSKTDVPLNDVAAGWDGTHRGRDMLPGVYAWRAVVEYLDGFTEEISGDVTLVR